jgi:hypothetical protein
MTNNKIPTDINERLKEYRRQQLASSGNRRDLYREYDKSTITTNLDSPEVQEAFGST